MIGVVVWSNPAREKAVIWCEDHEALAYLEGAGNMIAAAHWPEPGDLVEFETELVGDLRFAQGVSLLGDRGRAVLPDLLRDKARATPLRPRSKAGAGQDLRPASEAPQDLVQALRFGAAAS